MREAAVAARTEAAHKRQVEAVVKLAGEERADELRALTGPQRYPEYAKVLQAEKVADILEELADEAGTDEEENSSEENSSETAWRSPEPRHADLTFLTDEQVNALSEAGYDTLPAIQEASDEDLEAVPTIGKAAVRKIRANARSEAFAKRVSGE